MDSPTAPTIERRLRRSDCLLLFTLCAVLYGFSLAFPRMLDPHETVHCLNVREMIETGEWVIPTYAGRPWLERPPAPHWLTAAGVLLAGDMSPDRAFRISSIMMATLAVFVFAWAVAGCLGREWGLLSAALLASMREFAAYAVAPECDIFLAGAVTIAGSLLLRILFDPVARESRTGFFGGRSWPVVAYFALVGATNAMKGPLFGLFFTLLPLGAFWIWDRTAARVKPFVWLWGWLLLLGIGSAWPLAAYLRYPDVVDLWAVDYGLRWRYGYLGEPFWYYAAHHPWNLFPWSLAVGVGLVVTVRAVLGLPTQAESENVECRSAAQPLGAESLPLMRFVWCWALAPVLFFSLFKGKHHHYMLHCMAPAAVLGAIGVRRIWAWLQERNLSRRGLWPALLFAGLPGAVLGYLFRAKFPGPDWIWICWAIAWPVTACAFWYAFTRPRWSLAIGGCVAITAVFNLLIFEYRTLYMDDYRDDYNLLAKALEAVPADRPLFVLNEEFDPLNASWNLLYLNGRGQLLHNHTFLYDDRIVTPEVYVLARQSLEPKLALYGTPVQLEQSLKTRRDKPYVNRYTLYRLNLRPDLPKVSANVRMSPNNATGRAAGPYLEPPGGYAANKESE